MRRSGLFPVLSIFWLVLAVSGAEVVAQGPVDLHPELVSGQDLPGVEQFWWGLGGVKANRSGDIVFLTSLLPSLGSAGDYGIFLKRSGTITRVLVEGDQLPDSAGIFSIDDGFVPAFDLNDNGTVVVVIPSGVLLRDSSGLRWVMRRGAHVEGTSLTISTFLGTVLVFQDDRWDAFRPFLNDEGVVVFRARVSDGRMGVFRASASTGIVPVMLAGDPVPGRPGLLFGDTVEQTRLRLFGDHLLLLLPGYEAAAGVYMYETGKLSPVLLVGDAAPGAGPVKSISEAALIKNGTVALSFRFTGDSGDQEAGLALWSAAKGFSKLVLQTDLPEFGDDWLIDFADISLDDAGRVFFAAAGQARNWIYVMKDGEIRKIVADGEATPLGGTFHLAIPPPVFDPITYLPPSVYLELTTTNGTGDVAFMADVRGTDYGRIPFLWSGESLQPIPFRDREADEAGGLTVTGLGLFRSFTGEKLLLGGSLCCPEKNAVFTASPAAPRHSLIPLIAIGLSGEIQYITRVDLVNHSPFPAMVLLTPHWEGQDPYPPSVYPWLVFVGPGETGRRSLYIPQGLTGVFRGYLEVSVEGGAGISASGTVEVWNTQTLLSKTVLASTTPTTETEIAIEREAGEKAFALANPADSDSQVTFTLLDAAGKVKLTKKKLLSPGAQTSFLLGDLFPGLEPSFLGRLRAQSSRSFLLTALTMTGFQVSVMPLGRRLPEEAGKWTLTPVYPGWVRQVTTSRAGSVAFLVEGNGIRVVQGGQVYDVSAERIDWPDGNTTTLPPQREDDIQLIGFSSDEGLYFTARYDPNDPNLVALFLWHPGRISAIARAGDEPEKGSHLLFDPHTALRVSASGALYLTAYQSDDHGIVTGTDVYRFDGGFHKLFSVPAYSVAEEHMDVSGDDVAFSTSDRLVFWRQGVLLTVLQDWQTPGGQHVGPIDELEVSPAGKVYFRALSGLFVSDGVKTERVVAPGDPAPGMSGYKIDYINAIRVNARDLLVYQAAVRKTDDTWSPSAFFQVGTTTTQQTVLVPKGGSFEKDMWTFGPDFQWTDEDELIFSGSRPGQAGVYARRGSGTELVTAPRLSPFDDSPPGWFSYLSDFWPSLGPGPLLTIRTSGSQPFGLYQAVPDNRQTFVFPLAASSSAGDESYESSFLISNSAERATDVRVWLYDSGGRVQWTGQTAAASGETKLLGIAEAGDYSGWVRIEATGGRVTIVERLAHRRDGEVVSQFEVPSTGPRTESFVGLRDYREIPSVALVNPYNAPEEVIVDLLDSGLEIAYQERITLPANGRKALYLSELFPGVSTFRYGLLRFRSSMPISVLGLSFQDECMVPYTRFP